MTGDGSSLLLILRMVFSLVIVLVTLLALVRFVQRRQGGGIRSSRRANVPVRVVTRQALSRNASIQVVEIGRETLVLGVTDTGVNVLRELPVDSVLGQTVAGDELDDEPHDTDPTRATRRTAWSAQTRAAQTGAAAQTVQRAFDVVLSRVALTQGQQADTVEAQVMSRRGRHRG